MTLFSRRTILLAEIFFCVLTLASVTSKAQPINFANVVKVAPERDISIIVVPDAEFSVIGAPLVLNLCISNRMAAPFRFFFNEILLPHFSVSTTDDARPIVADSIAAERSFEEWPVTLEPATVRTVKIPLNQYLQFPHAGRYRIKYELEIHYLQEVNGRNSGRFFKSEGVFGIELVQGDQKLIEKRLGALNELLLASEGMEQTVVAKLLCSIHSPLTVKYIRQIFQADRLRPVNINCKLLAIPALGNIHTEESKALLRSVVLADGSLTEKGLEQLAERGIVLTLQEMEPFFRAKDPGVKYAALRYAEKIGGSQYSPVVEALMADPNTAIATKAKAVLEAVKR